MMLKSILLKIKFFICLFLVLGGLAPFAMADFPFRHAAAMRATPKYQKDFYAFDYVRPDAPKNGVLRQSAFGSFDTFNPFAVNGIPPAGIGLVYDSLMKSSADEPFTLYGLIADGIHIYPDGKGVVFHINPKARFQDSSPVTAEDVVFSFNTLKEKGLPSYRYYYQDVREVKALDRQTVAFLFKETAENQELPFILGELPILPKKDWQDKDFEKTSLTPPVGSGPYLIDSFEAGRKITYKRNPAYWALDLNVNRGFYNFEKISYEYFRDTTVAMEAFKSGVFDIRQENEAKKWVQFQQESEADLHPNIKPVSFTHQLPSGMQGFVFNLRRPVFQNILVRRALGLVFDFEWMNKNLFYGLYRRTTGFFDNSYLKAPLQPTKEERAVWQKAGADPDTYLLQGQIDVKDLKTMRKRLRAALDLLNAAGWHVQDGVLKNKNGKPFQFEILLESGSSTVWERVVLPFIGQLKRLGIQARVRSVDAIQYKNRLDSFDYDMIVSVWGQSLSPGNEQRYFWGKEASLSEGSMNYAGVADEVIDNMIEQIISAKSATELQAAVQALDRALQRWHIVIAHWHSPYLRFLMNKAISYPDVTPMKGPDVSTWWRE